MLAGVHHDLSNGNLNVFGDGGNNVGQVQIVGDQVRASIDGFQVDVNLSEVQQIVFIGYGGDDQFTNNTHIQGLLYGHGGNDSIYGGSGADSIVGGPGIDQLHGNDGNDSIWGVQEADVITGGEGNDRIFGGHGDNTIHGGNGDDIIYGGDDVDTIFGEAGIDQIFGLGGNDILDSGDGGVAGSAGISQADLVLGLDGDDTITGGNGLNVFWGGNGVDTMTGGAAENRIHGQNGDDIITGGAFFDYLAGSRDNDLIRGLGSADYILAGEGDDLVYAGDGNDIVYTNTGNDVVYGENGNDTIRGSLGDDTIYGGEGDDTALHDRVSTNYRITGSIGSLTVTDTTTYSGVDQVNDVEFLQYSDVTNDAVPSASQRVIVQPIIVSNSNGTNTAEYFGNATQAADILESIDDIFVQADIDIEWLTSRTWNNTFANVGNGGTRPTGDLDSLVNAGDNAGIGHTDALVIDMYFVEVVPGFNDTGENVANGLAYVGGGGIGAHVGDNLVSFQSGRDVVAEVMAHEIAHNLGLFHNHIDGNLMAEDHGGTNLTAAQIQTIRDSEFSQNV